jgi:hypothetical protein
MVDERIGINQGIISDVCNRITESIALVSLEMVKISHTFSFVMPAGKERRYFGRKKIKLLVLHAIPSRPVVIPEIM